MTTQSTFHDDCFYSSIGITYHRHERHVPQGPREPFSGDGETRGESHVAHKRTNPKADESESPAVSDRPHPFRFRGV